MTYGYLRVPFIGAIAIEKHSHPPQPRPIDVTFSRFDIDAWVGRWHIILSLPDCFDRRA